MPPETLAPPDLPPGYDPERDEGFEPEGETVPDSPGPETAPPPDPDPEPNVPAPEEPAGDPGEDGQPQPADLGPEEPGEEEGMVLDGDVQLSLAVGGSKPTSAVLKIIGAKVDLDGQIKKGDHLRVALDLRVGEVDFVDKIGPDGTIASTSRVHKARIEGWERLV